jgi:cysteine desulfurase
MSKSEKKIYFDFAATTPVDPDVFDEMKKYFSDDFGNPLSLHQLGQSALKAVDISREKIKDILEAGSVKEIIFTSSATESNNLIIKGIAFDNYFQNADLRGYKHGLTQKPHLISSEIEHISVIEILKDLEKLGIAEISLIKPEKTGLISGTKIAEAIKENTVLVSIHYVNSETGVIQPIQQIAKIIKDLRSPYNVIFHTDATQVLTEEISVKNLGVDAMTLSAHKIYGPKGTALLYKKEAVKIAPLITGSGQEFGIRAGTENVAGIVGFTKALEKIRNPKSAIRNNLIEVRDCFIKRLKKTKINFEINVAVELSSPKILNVYFPDAESQDLLVYLSENNIYVSAGMSCQARASISSPVVGIMYPNTARAKRSIRFSFGQTTTKDEINFLVEALEKFFKKS